MRICLFPDVEVSHSVTRSIAILSNGLLGILVICKEDCWTLAFSHWQRTQCKMYFLMSLFIPFPIVLAFDEAISARISLMT